ncbi:MAG: hypothetical protein AAFO91_15190 [Bacteroidota bacterium]
MIDRPLEGVATAARGLPPAEGGRRVAGVLVEFEQMEGALMKGCRVET